MKPFLYLWTMFELLLEAQVMLVGWLGLKQHSSYRQNHCFIAWL